MRKFEHRCVKVFIPARENIPFFYELIDLMLHYGYNKLMIEVGGAMEYERHPEINEGWIEYCKKFTDYQGQSVDVQHSKQWSKNAIHMENGGGNFLTKKEVHDLVEYCKKCGIDVIPEVPCLSHCDYMLTRHPELAERAEDDLPDTYCPSNPGSYELLWDILDEVIEVFEPTTVQIGHDEFYSFCICDKCKGKDPARLYADDIIKIYNYLKDRGIKTEMWGDKLLNAITDDGRHFGGSFRVIEHADKFLERIPETYASIDMIPNDIIIDHWYWSMSVDWDNDFLSRGFPMIFSNFSGYKCYDFYQRCDNLLGVSISNWSLLNCDHMQRNCVLYNIAYTSKLLRGIDKPFKETALEVSKELYEYRIRNIKKYVEVTHRADIRLEHQAFVDGYMIDKEGDYLGKYTVTFSDGSTLEVPLYYNLNVGTSSAKFFDAPIKAEYGVRMYDEQNFEATYSCMLIDTQDGIYYKYAFEIPENASVTDIKLTQDSKHGNVVSFKGYEVKER